MQGYAIWRLKAGSNLQFEQYGFARVGLDQLEGISQVGQLFTTSNEVGEFLPPSEINHLQCTEWAIEERHPSQAETAKVRPELGLVAAPAAVVAA